MAILTDEQKVAAARSMARGTTRAMLITRFEKEVLEAGPVENPETLRRRISNELGAIDKTGPRFAESKYSQVYEVELALMKEEYAALHADIRELVIDAVQEDLTFYKELSEAYRATLGGAIGVNAPENASEVNAYVNTALKIRQTFKENAVQLMELTARLKENIVTPALPDEELEQITGDFQE